MEPTILIVPGLRDHVEDHWQTFLGKKIAGSVTVPPIQENRLSCAARVAALEATMATIKGPVVLVAHSAGVMIAAHWAQTHIGPIRGALLAAPADLETPLPPGYPPIEALRENGWLPIPRRPLPFPSIVAGSTNDPLARFERIEELARGWGARFENVGAVGHLNPASGYGEWKQAETFLQELSGA
jgi:uncharacterized protein